MTVKSYRGAIKELKRRQDRISKERDAMRNLEAEVATLGDDLDEAIRGIEDAIDALSRLQ